MKNTVFVHQDGSRLQVAGSFEVEPADLKPGFGTPIFALTSELKPRSFAAMQLRAQHAVKALLRSRIDRLLFICSSGEEDVLSIAAQLVKRAGGTPTVRVAPSRTELFGAKDQSSSGLCAQELILVLPAALLLDHPKFFGPLDAALASNPNLKLIVCGDGGERAEISLIWQAVNAGMHAELNAVFPAADGINTAGMLLASYSSELGLPPFTAAAVQLVCQWAVRQSGDKGWLFLPEIRLRSLVCSAAQYARGGTVSERAVLKAMAASDFHVNALASEALRSYRDRQLLIATQGAAVGQVNGLSVMETYGSSFEYGEPMRITAVLRAGGEGDVIDIERKADLAGQIHAKAMMIINGFITKEFAAEQPLPVSASLVFEQSYSEIDGDSASLTGLCAVLSCLAALPIRQDLAVTGAVDQFGHVQPVGGVNEKIEGFFRVCRLRGLTGTQGVVIPETCLNQLVLRPSVVQAVEQGRFHIYTVNSVTEAIKILTTVDWGSRDQDGTVCQRIAARLTEISMSGHNDRPWWKFWGE